MRGVRRLGFWPRRYEVVVTTEITLLIRRMCRKRATRNFCHCGQPGQPSTLNLSVTSADQAKRNYERRPYPGPDLAEIERKGRSIPPLKWMQALGRTGQPTPERVLVAGCGTGAEAFVMRRRMPRAEIVAVDFSPRSIAIAQRLQRSVDLGKPIAFRVADLTATNWMQTTGDDFDLITCHGVLSYLPEPGRVLQRFAGCLRVGGALYLGVNGEAHPATRLRPWLSTFGLDVGQMRDERRLRDLLGLWDSLHDDGIGELAYMSASYLASDVCGTHFNNWSLARWTAEANSAGWALAGSMLLPLSLRLTTEGGHHRLLFPAGVGRLAERLDQTRPASFHQLLFHRATRGDPDVFAHRDSERRLRWTGLYTVKFLRSDEQGDVQAIFSSRTFNLQFASKLTRRQAAGLSGWLRASAEPFEWAKHLGRSETVRQMLWLWSGLGVVVPEPGESGKGLSRVKLGFGAAKRKTG